MINSKGFRDEDGNIITIPGASVKYNAELAGHLAQFGENGEIEDGGEKSQFAPENHTHVITSLSNEDYDSTVDVGKINRADDELDGVDIYGKDVIRIRTGAKSVFVEESNIDNLNCALLGLRIAFVRDENGDYAINSELKEHLNDLIEKVPENKCVPCLVYARWWNDSVSNYDSGYFPGTLCRHTYTTPGIPRTIFLSFLGNLFFATRTANNDFPNTWTKFENPFATV